MEYALKYTEDNIEVISRTCDIKVENVRAIVEPFLKEEAEVYFIVSNIDDPKTRAVYWTHGIAFRRYYEFVGPENLTRFIPLKEV